MKMRALNNPLECFDLILPPGKEFDLVGLGQNAVDYFCVLPEYPRFGAKMKILRYEMGAGGMVAGAVVFAARMGLKGKYIGKVGSDETGRFSLESLQKESIDISSLVVEEGARNHCSFIMVDQKSGERTILWDRDQRLNFRSGKLKRDDVCAGRVLLLDGDDHEAALQCALWAQEAGIPVVIDLDHVVPNSKELLPLVDFLIVSSNLPTEFTGLTDPEGALLALARYCRGFAAATIGAQGAIAVLGDGCIHFRGFPVHAVDTTGAGDVFHGGFIYGLLQNWPLHRIMAFANAAAALNCTQLGARAGTASLADIRQLAEQAADTNWSTI
jgi:sulfofructose kinase